MMHAQPPNAMRIVARLSAIELVEEAPRPGLLVGVWPRSHKAQVHAVIRNPGGVALVLDRVVLRIEVASAAPALVSHAPVAHVVRLRRAVGLARLGQRGG